MPIMPKDQFQDHGGGRACGVPLSFFLSFQSILPFSALSAAISGIMALLQTLPTACLYTPIQTPSLPWGLLVVFAIWGGGGAGAGLPGKRLLLVPRSHCPLSVRIVDVAVDCPV